MELIAVDTAPPDADSTDAGPDDPTINPRAELEALERAHVLIANAAMQQIADYQAEIELLRATVFEHRSRAATLRRLAVMLPPGGDIASGLGQAMFDALKPQDPP